VVDLRPRAPRERHLWLGPLHADDLADVHDGVGAHDPCLGPVAPSGEASAVFLGEVRESLTQPFYVQPHVACYAPRGGLLSQPLNACVLDPGEALAFGTLRRLAPAVLLPTGLLLVSADILLRAAL
jgi:hypothetical protein